MNNEVVIFLAAPTVMCLILAVIHCYLGLHVLARGVIFVDLSLAQVASFGATLSLLWTGEHESSTTYFVSLGATFVAAALFALARRFEHKFSQEAVIGIVYALASAAVFLAASRSHAKTKDDAKDDAKGVAPVSWFWDFLFYALFGVVITSSTHVAGVLMVFSFLIVPSILGQVFFKTIRGRLLFGWSLSTVLSVFGMYASYKLDVPVGALIVVLFASLPILALIGFGLKSVISTDKTRTA